VYTDPNSLEGKTVAVQGLGAVGHNVVSQLHDLGAETIVCDIDSEKVAAMVEKYGSTAVETEAIYDTDRF